MPGAVVGAVAVDLAPRPRSGSPPACATPRGVPDDPNVALIGQAVNAVIATVLWAYLASIAILVGGELNAVVRGRAARAAAAARILPEAASRG